MKPLAVTFIFGVISLFVFAHYLEKISIDRLEKERLKNLSRECLRDVESNLNNFYGRKTVGPCEMFPTTLSFCACGGLNKLVQELESK